MRTQSAPKLCHLIKSLTHLIVQELGGELIRGGKEGDKALGTDLMCFWFVTSTLDPVLCSSTRAKGSYLLSRHLGFGVIRGLCLKFLEEWVSEGLSSMEDLCRTR